MPDYDLIKDIPLFNDFTDKEKTVLAGMDLFLLKFKKGDFLIKEGDISTTLFLLVEGDCLITKSQDDTTIRLSKLKPGELFGEMSWVSGKPRQSNVVANDEVLVMKMDDDFFSELSPQMSSKIKDYLIRLLISRLDGMNAAIMKISQLMRS